MNSNRTERWNIVDGRCKFPAFTVANWVKSKHSETKSIFDLFRQIAFVRNYRSDFINWITIALIFHSIKANCLCMCVGDEWNWRWYFQCQLTKGKINVQEIILTLLLRCFNARSPHNRHNGLYRIAFIGKNYK